MEVKDGSDVVIRAHVTHELGLAGSRQPVLGRYYEGWEDYFCCVGVVKRVAAPVKNADELDILPHKGVRIGGLVRDFQLNGNVMLLIEAEVLNSGCHDNRGAGFVNVGLGCGIRRADKINHADVVAKKNGHVATNGVVVRAVVGLIRTDDAEVHEADQLKFDERAAVRYLRAFALWSPGVSGYVKRVGVVRIVTEPADLVDKALFGERRLACGYVYRIELHGEEADFRLFHATDVGYGDLRREGKAIKHVVIRRFGHHVCGQIVRLVVVARGLRLR